MTDWRQRRGGAAARGQRRGREPWERGWRRWSPRSGPGDAPAGSALDQPGTEVPLWPSSARAAGPQPRSRAPPETPEATDISQPDFVIDLSL